MKKMSIRERLDAFWSGERPDVIPFTIYQNEWRHTANDPAWNDLYANGLGVTWHIPSVREEWPNDIQMRDIPFVEDGKKLLRRTVTTPVGEIFEIYDDDWRQKHFLETIKDYKVMTYIAKHAKITPEL